MNNRNIGLSIDTSTRHALVGISVDGGSISELSWRSQRNHSVELVPALKRLLTHVQLTLADVSVIYVAIGPGGFSALRVGISTALALAKSLNIPLVTIGTLEVEVFPYRHLHRDVVALIGAGRSRCYVGHYRPDEPNVAVDAKLVDRKWFFDNQPSDVVICGEMVSELSSSLRDLLTKTCQVISEPAPTRHAASMAAIGFKKLKSSNTTPLSDVEPIYLKSSQITSVLKRWSA